MLFSVAIWDFVYDQRYRNNPQTIGKLKTDIQTSIKENTESMLKKVKNLVF